MQVRENTHILPSFRGEVGAETPGAEGRGPREGLKD